MINQHINADNNGLIHLEGIYQLKKAETRSLFIGYKPFNLVTIDKPNLLIDGANAKILVDLSDIDSEVNIFRLTRNAANVRLVNLHIEVIITGECNGQINIVHNSGRNNKISNCKIDISGGCQFNANAIYNQANIDTHMDTPADNLTVSGNYITVRCSAAETTKGSVLCGINNHLANSINISNNYLFIQNIGIGEKQQAIGMQNSGRFARIENNNIKANASHNTGKLLEQAHAYGVYNTGMYMVFTGNNCVGEWGGKCVGLYSGGAFVNITGNKILATHTIMGRTVVLAAPHNILGNNIITNTSRNPHFVEILVGDNVVSNNYMQALSAPVDCFSGCGILVRGAEGQKITRCNISGNVVSNVKDFGIVLLHTEKNIIGGNQLAKFTQDNNYTALYTENSDDKISDNLSDGQNQLNVPELKDKLFRNYDEAVKSIIE